MSSLFGTIQKQLDAARPTLEANQAASLASDKAVTTTNTGAYERTDVNWYGGRTTSHVAGTAWDTSQDAGVGRLDSAVKAETAKQAANDSTFDQKNLDKLKQQRSQANSARWATANLSNAPELANLIKTGQLSYMDLGSIDVSEINDPAKLMGSVNDLMKAKTAAAAPPAGTPPPADPNAGVNAAAKGAQDALDASNAGLQQGAANIMSNALNPFDKSVAAAGAGIESNSGRAAQSMGLGGASSEAANSSEQLQANATAQREVVEGNAKTDIQKFIDTQLTNETNQQVNIDSMDTAHKVDLQRQGIESLKTEITNHVDMSDAAAAAQVTSLNSAIDDWNAAVKRGEEGTAEHNKILGIVGGLVMAGAGAAAIALTDGAATPFVAPVIAGGISSAVNSARS